MRHIDKTNEIINPTTDKECEEKFIYTAYGDILEANRTNELATQTIKVLNLNAPLLKKIRKVVWEEIRNATADGEDIVSLKNYYEKPSNLCVVYRYYLKSQFGM